MSSAAATSATIIGLIATRERPGLLAGRSLPSVLRQMRPPDHLVIVHDGRQQEMEGVRAAAAALLDRALPWSLERNRRTPGAAGAWNSGVDWICSRWPGAWIAILDDDDSWDPEHIEACERAIAPEISAVVSGLRIVGDGWRNDRACPESLCWRDFLCRNPGWQGSNTFIRAGVLRDAGGFNEALVSTLDRDLAVRLLRTPGFTVAFTGRTTATYYIENGREYLSRKGSPSKRAGLLKFWELYAPLMTEEEKQSFRERSRSIFAVEVPG